MLLTLWNDDKQLEIHMVHWGIGILWRISGSLEHHKWKGNQLRMLESSFTNNCRSFHCFILQWIPVPWLLEDTHGKAADFQADTVSPSEWRRMDPQIFFLGGACFLPQTITWLVSALPSSPRLQTTLLPTHFQGQVGTDSCRTSSNFPVGLATERLKALLELP